MTDRELEYSDLANFDHTRFARIEAYWSIRDALNELQDRQRALLSNDDSPEEDILTVGQVSQLLNECLLSVQYPDLCSNCRQTPHNWPLTVERNDRGGIRADYRCRHCGHEYFVSWTVPSEGSEESRVF
jgi:hypothetical protein